MDLPYSFSWCSKQWCFFGYTTVVTLITMDLQLMTIYNSIVKNTTEYQQFTVLRKQHMTVATTRSDISVMWNMQSCRVSCLYIVLRIFIVVDIYIVGVAQMAQIHVAVIHIAIFKTTWWHHSLVCNKNDIIMHSCQYYKSSQHKDIVTCKHICP